MQGDFDKVLRQRKAVGATLLCVCPNSPAIVRAAIKAFSRAEAPLLLVATLNQVDTDGGYTGWTPQLLHDFVRSELAAADSNIPIFLCLDHGGPWKKRKHSAIATHAECLQQTITSIKACIDAGYTSLHLDATGVHPKKQPDSSRQYILDLTVRLQELAQAHSRTTLHFEVGTDEDGLGNNAADELSWFANHYAKEIKRRGLSTATFFVGDVGTTYESEQANENRMRALAEIAGAHNTLLKIHFADDIPNLSAFPECGAGAANIGPGLSAIEYRTYRDAANTSNATHANRVRDLDRAVVESLTQAGLLHVLVPPADVNTIPDRAASKRLLSAARYVWNAPRVIDARQALAQQLHDVLDLDERVSHELERNLMRYLEAFKLTGLNSRATA